MKRKLLVVDDDEEIRNLMIRLLEDLGDVVTLSNGKEALANLNKIKPALMLLDFSMPEMNGMEVLKAVKQLAPQLPVLMLTGETDLKIAQKILEGGAHAFITKPFDGASLHEEVKRLIATGGHQNISARPWHVERNIEPPKK